MEEINVKVLYCLRKRFQNQLLAKSYDRFFTNWQKAKILAKIQDITEKIQMAENYNNIL